MGLRICVMQIYLGIEVKITVIGNDNTETITITILVTVILYLLYARNREKCFSGVTYFNETTVLR